MTPVFLDTVGVLALLDADDQWHAAAVAAYDQLAAARRRLVTTELVLLECGNAAARRPYRTAIDDLRATLNRRGDVVDVSADELDLAWRAYRQGVAGDAGIVDHVSFLVMRRLGLIEAFTNDRHFSAAGFQVLF
jgi:hypothetical protein